jgi:hypothetical protein
VTALYAEHALGLVRLAVAVAGRRRSWIAGRAIALPAIPDLFGLAAVRGS